MNKDTKSSSLNSGKQEVGYKRPPKNRQFGQPEGNPPGRGFWKKENTLRWKLQEVSKLNTKELEEMLQNPEVGEYEKNVARTILEMEQLEPNKRWQILEGLANQDSGYPKQQVEQHNINVKSILPKTEKASRK